ncbi:hypothetical protein EJ05DRAFT_351378 [Pseudovirgaria hyperparasitica]|uniref:Uncharacterized protein n=1 Tax=Pseudovirgaria hyperparasitica TaxID=470096 RepID=A0A6A6W6E0_9PEZI|nr:uncharacterized protein EJ05DRAFT_351378 [Pseudovirgaria hyperparasitica]KAF2758442.1 hypothetical protein EJ05DRAFT_351378 [Pseudovirgaria hyperparasitica]
MSLMTAMSLLTGMSLLTAMSLLTTYTFLTFDIVMKLCSEGAWRLMNHNRPVLEESFDNCWRYVFECEIICESSSHTVKSIKSFHIRYDS